MNFRRGVRLATTVSIVALAALIFVWKFKSFELSSEQMFFDFGCSIIGEDKKLYWSTNFLHCIYFEDGSYLAAKNEELFFFDSMNFSVWKKPIAVHHQMKRYGNFIYLISEEYVDQGVDKPWLRKDLLVRLSLEDLSVKTIDYTDFKSTFKELGSLVRVRDRKHNGRSVIEKSHLNAINRIPNSKLSHIHPSLKEGNFILTDSSFSQVTVVSENFDEILWSVYFNFNSQLHDVQILDSGEVLAFLNGNKEQVSSVVFLDLVKLTYDVWFGGDKGPYFFASWAGGVQRLENGSILLNANQECLCAYIINPENRKIVWQADFERITGKHDFFQEAKFHPHLNKFLKMNSAAQ